MMWPADLQVTMEERLVAITTALTAGQQEAGARLEELLQRIYQQECAIRQLLARYADLAPEAKPSLALLSQALPPYQQGAARP